MYASKVIGFAVKKVLMEYLTEKSVGLISLLWGAMWHRPIRKIARFLQAISLSIQILRFLLL